MERQRNIANICKKCEEICDEHLNPALTCVGECRRKIHLRCLDDSRVRMIDGDVFFDLHCSQCFNSRYDLTIRQKLPWTLAIILALHNLRLNPQLKKKNGYFHPKKDICRYISYYWYHMFSKTLKRKKNWRGTVLEVLSNYRGRYFQSKLSEHSDQVWALIHNQPPETIIQMSSNTVLTPIEEQNTESPSQLEDSPTNSKELGCICRDCKKENSINPQEEEEQEETSSAESEDDEVFISKGGEDSNFSKIPQFKDINVSAPAMVKLFNKLDKRKVRKHRLYLDPLISEDTSFYDFRLQEYCELNFIRSPYTNKLLNDFIKRDTSYCPLWLKVMSELLVKVNECIPEWRPPPVASIDYSYLRPQHIQAMNSLCAQFFWPGIDLTKCLQYPDFTCVVLYKKVIVGFLATIPQEVGEEIYISFLLVRPEWRHCGIGHYMLYHLLKQYSTQHITVHVPITSPALGLFKNFGFVQEEFLPNFYDKYIPASSKKSNHAFFLRFKSFSQNY